MIDNNTIARPYARAAFELAREKKALAKWSDALAAAKHALADGQVAKFLSHPALNDEQKLDFLTDLMKKAAGKTSVFAGGDKRGVNFLKLLIEYDRVNALPEIADQFETLKAEVENTVDVTVTSAVALTAAQKKALTNALEKRLERSVNLKTEIDESLIGGAVIRAGDIVFDGSLRSSLQGLSNALVS
ncbi:MAG: F0F1 ATP synthase subunit delta [Woeseiaceae bacterium]|nr:F0F1 ATP synthase subunit delta [Woeseiaceae bacterium]